MDDPGGPKSATVGDIHHFGPLVDKSTNTNQDNPSINHKQYRNHQHVIVNQKSDYSPTIIIKQTYSSGINQNHQESLTITIIASPTISVTQVDGKHGKGQASGACWLDIGLINAQVLLPVGQGVTNVYGEDQPTRNPLG